MKIVPSVVLGIGSSGSYVVANLERILYEVLGDAKLDVFRLISIDTDNTRKEDEPPPGGKRGLTLSAHESDLGRAIFNLQSELGEEFSWCPKDIKIQGQGAGNIRAGGRLMFFNKCPEIWNAIRTAIAEVQEAARRPQSEDTLIKELRRRAVNPQEGIVDIGTEVVYVVGTLAGGTGSGMCVDLGYAIHDAAPTAKRYGLFFVADKGSLPVYMQNSWAAMKDLEYFCDNPSAFHVTWPKLKRKYQANNVLPYDRIYLLSQQDEHERNVLQYSADANAPLLAMTAMHIATDLLGLSQRRSSELVNLNAHVEGPPKNWVFLNLNLRGISYPKYEISEAAACKVIADTICSGWLDEQYHDSATGKIAVREDTIRTEGRDRWSFGLAQVWGGTRGSVNWNEWVEKICGGQLSRPNADLEHEFAAPVMGTIFSQVAQQVPSRLGELKKMIKAGLGQKLEATRNVKAGSLYLDGLREGIQRTLAYWDALKIPRTRDDQAWAGMAHDLIDEMLQRRSAMPVRLLLARRDFVRDQFQEISLRLQMYVMRSALVQAKDWIDAELVEWVRQLKRTLESVRSASVGRHSSVVDQLAKERPPVLKLSRIKPESGDRLDGFRMEIEALVASRPDPGKPLLRVTGDGDFEGILATVGDQHARNEGRVQEIFLELKNLLQAILLRKLEEAGSVDMASEIVQQRRIPQAAMFLQDTLALSIATRGKLQKEGALPSFVIARDTIDAQTLLDNHLRPNSPGLPSMKCVALPMFDHMVLFYQEAARVLPDALTEAQQFKAEYDQRLKTDGPEYIDPLRQLKIGQKGVTP